VPFPLGARPGTAQLGSMRLLATFVIGALPCLLSAQVAITGRVVDETGAGVKGARIELRPASGPAVTASSDGAGNFRVSLAAPGEYSIQAERLGFYLFQGKARQFEPGASELTITLNHLQEFSDHIDVTYSPPAIDPAQPAEHRELDNTEIQAVPYPAPQDYRNALPMIDGVVQDNSGRAHFNGAQSSQTNYTLDGFNISDPVTGRLDTRLNIDSIQSMDVQTSRFSAENGRGSAGVLDLKTKMGDDRLRFAGTNFIPGVSTEGGIHVNKWTPRLELSGPIAKGRAWFHNGFDAFYSNDLIHGLPRGQDRTSGLTASDLSRFQVNLTPSNILTGSFLFNLADVQRYGLSFTNPSEATTTHKQTFYMSTLRDQTYLGGGALLDVAFADSRGVLRDTPQGDSLFEITPEGNRGNYFTGLGRHFYRQQWIADLFAPTLQWHGAHHLKFGIDFEREAFHQQVVRHDYAVLRDDNSIARYVTFSGNPFEARKNFEGAQYVQDAWNLRDGLLIEAGVRAEWNEIVRDLEVAPRLALAWAPRRLADTKFSVGWGMYYDAISLDLISSRQEQMSLATFYSPTGGAMGPLATSFIVNDRSLRAPYADAASFSVERKLPRGFYLRSGVTSRSGHRGFTFVPQTPELLLTPNAAVAGNTPFPGASYELMNARRPRYEAYDISLRHTFAARYEWFIGYTRSSSRSNAAVDYNLENPIFAPQAPGPFPWDTPNRVHMWGWAPLPGRLLPSFARFLTRNTTAAYLVEYRTGFPFGVVSEEGFMIGAPNSRRYPDYFNINLQFERQFRALHYLWAWRFGFNNLTNNGNPNAVNNVMGTPQFLAYGRGQARAFTVRLRLLGRK
jgi:hypothetical protein